MKPPVVKPEAVLEQLKNYSRKPFLKELAKFLGCSPSKKAVKEWAEQTPDRWSQAVAILTRAAGYTEKIEAPQTNILVVIQGKSDMELAQMMRDLDAKISNQTKQITDAEIV